ncbi:MAG: SurA N-terminal domain-containing protein [bacterium]|nr:SurA N-terminal domain-containing protein [bacterium]
MATKKAVKKTSKVPAKTQEVSMSKSFDMSTVKDRIKQPRFFIPLIVLALVVVAFLLKGLFVAALVNGQPISRLSLIQELEKQGGKQALSALVNQTLILQEAKKKNITVSQKEVDASVKQVEDSLKQQGQNLDEALAMQGMTKQDFTMQLELRSMVEKLLADKIKVTDKEITDYMEKNKDTLPTNLKEDEVKKGVKQQLAQEKLATASQAWLVELQKNAKINYFVNY